MTKAFDSAVRLLTRREHSALELYNKLKQKGYSSIEIKEALDTCQRMNLQNDGRFVEVYSHLRIRQGYGPLKISQELSSKGIDKGLIHQFLQQEQDNWLHYALNVWQKKSKGQLNFSFDEVQKQLRFLLYRGFSMDVVAQVKKELKGTSLLHAGEES
ncbi:recombination regulator RecX [Legionella longbeachae]|uniref:Regulatory protein RecX n=1 Tax=Legionella longbeachae serogroup 1 (strain NSW150) TaxID=661367 RepID=D3HRE6_LEGLN|nr:recombination regulator RecX [Legionella longbeachae]VEE01979.1 Regulatory protein RecX [Legionella oakridgensis]HBD7396769.1 recombination regulator RecX [Legionella pneumophila]ARB91712.1 recombination regulator RecX [Legionella longbeachae]ARM35144.1 recombination regulator RecX [Legionella longbeachae]EEZ95414.1 regulatory protein RecX [Legionella longbeachae D-4968]